MSTAFQLTPAQAKKLGIDTGSTRTSKPRVHLSAEEKQVQQRVKQAEKFVQHIANFCHNLGWQIGLCRLLSDDPRNQDYPSIKDYEAVPNAVMAWREDRGCIQPRTRQLAWLWEIDTLSLEDIETRLRHVEVAA